LKIKELVNKLSDRATALVGDGDNGNGNYYDGDGVPQPHLDGTAQADYVYDYYLDSGIKPPWFEDYKQKRQGIPINWEHLSCYQDGRTKDETAYLIRKYFRINGNLEGCPYNYNSIF
jgi:hypothetical protein